MENVEEEDVNDEDSFDNVKFTCCSFKITEKYYMLGLFTICNAFLFADQNLLAPNLTVIAEEFNFTSDERDQYLGGYISLGFFAIGGVVSMITGFLADKLHRKSVFAVTVLIGELSCAATFFVPTTSKTDFWVGLWLTRSVTGVALGGAIPIQFSILGDLFSEEARGKAIAVFAIANGVGLAAGQGLAGFMSPDFRTPFLLVSIPAFFIVALFVFTTREPKRGQAEKALQNNKAVLEEDHTLDWEKFKKIFSVPTVALTILQGLPGTLPWGIIQIFLNDFLLVEGEKDTGAATSAIFVFGLGAGASTLAGGFFLDKYLATKPRLLPLVCAISTFIAPFFLILILRLADTLSGIAITVVMLLTGLLAGFAGIIIKGILLHVAIPETRGTAFAFQSLLDDLGRGLGPFSISVIISASSNREEGLVYGALGWIPTALIMFAIYFFIVGDVERSRALLKDVYGIDSDDESKGDVEDKAVSVELDTKNLGEVEVEEDLAVEHTPAKEVKVSTEFSI